MRHRLDMLLRPAIAVLAIVALAIVQVPTVMAATVRCCCGEHDAHHDCGCVDCPAGGHRGEASTTPSLRTCSTPSPTIALANLAIELAPIEGELYELVTVTAPAIVAAPLARLREAPPSPPPRR